MAKAKQRNKTAAELRAEAGKTMTIARKAQRELLRRAKIVEVDKYTELGRKALDFLQGKIDAKQLERVARLSELLITKDENKVDEEEKEDV